MAVQTCWQYRLAADQSDYLLDLKTKPDYDLQNADFLVEKDVTENPEPRFFRGLLNARYGKLTKAKKDRDFILSIDPNNPSYRALAAYIAAVGHETSHEFFNEGTITDARALSLFGEAAYLNGDHKAAQQWWTQAAKVDPTRASLAYLAGKKHLTLGHERIAAALLEECATMAPTSKEAKDARDLLPTLRAPNKSL